MEHAEHARHSSTSATSWSSSPPSSSSAGSFRGARSRRASSWSATAVVKPIPDRAAPAARGEAAEGRHPHGRRGRVRLPPTGTAREHQLLAAFAISWAMMGVSLVVLTGWGGNISLGQFGLAGMSGMVAANLIANNNIDFFVVLLAAGAVGAVVATIVGVPALRIRGPVPRGHDARVRHRARQLLPQPEHLPEVHQRLGEPAAAVGAVRPRGRLRDVRHCPWRSWRCRSSLPEECARPGTAAG